MFNIKEDNIMYNNDYRNNDELMHYGVLGMRWGVRRANSFAKKAATAKARGDKESYTKYSSKAKQITAKNRRLAGGQKVIDYTMKESLGKSIAKALIFGRYGAAKYNKEKANSADQGEAIIKGLIGNFANNATGGLASIIEPRLNKQLL